MRVVNVNGTVHTLYDKYKVFEIISRVSGIKKIDDNLLVNTPVLPDKEIQDNIGNDFNQISAIRDPQRIFVHADNGVVFLSGQVSFYRKKLLAQSVSSWQKGVKGLNNKIQVLPLQKAMSDKNLEAVLTAMRKDEFPDYDNIKISVKHGIATITGSVNYFYNKKEMEEEIKNVIGVKDVNNKLKVTGP